MKRTGDYSLTQTLVVSSKVFVAGAYGMAFIWEGLGSCYIDLALGSVLEVKP